MQRRISALVIVLLVVAALVWRCGRTQEALENSRPVAPPAAGAPAPGRVDPEASPLVTPERVEVAPGETAESVSTASEAPTAEPERPDLAARVIVSGWLGSRELVITALDIRVDTDSGLPGSAWVHERDGRLSTTRLSPGKHLIWLTHASAEHGNLASAIEGFDLAENEWKELHLELHALGTQRGRLDDAVPRPIRDGHVRVNLNRAGSGDEPYIDRDFEAPVREDGTFELADLPPGRGQIIALCSGWVSRRTPFDALEAATIRLGHEPAFGEIERILQEGGPETSEAQRIAVPAPMFVVAMEPTGSLVVTVLEQDGTPLAGATVSTSPNVSWEGVGSTIFPWREWRATTDALGRARIDDLPPDDSLWVNAYHDSFRMTRADRNETPSVKIASGKTAEFELVLEPKE